MYITRLCKLVKSGEIEEPLIKNISGIEIEILKESDPKDILKRWDKKWDEGFSERYEKFLREEIKI